MSSTYRIKPLVWEYRDPQRWVAAGASRNRLRYTIISDKWGLGVISTCGEFRNLAEAQAACQAHHEAALRQFLEPAE